MLAWGSGLARCPTGRLLFNLLAMVVEFESDPLLLEDLRTGLVRDGVETRWPDVAGY